MRYRITLEQENELKRFEEQGGSIDDLLAELEPASISQNEGNYHERPYNLIWESVLKLLVPLLKGNFEIPWQALCTLEHSWYTKPPNLAAFNAIGQSLKETQLMPCKFIRQNTVTKLIVNSAIWFEKGIGKEKIEFPGFEKVTDDLVVQLAEYNHYFCES